MTECPFPPYLFLVVLTITGCKKTKFLEISTALAQSKRPVNGDGTTLSANIKNVKSLLDPAKKGQSSKNPALPSSPIPSNLFLFRCVSINPVHWHLFHSSPPFFLFIYFYPYCCFPLHLILPVSNPTAFKTLINIAQGWASRCIYSINEVVDFRSPFVVKNNVQNISL